jgi:transcriptional regulator with XRE-family HTH domain
MILYQLAQKWTPPMPADFELFNGIPAKKAGELLRSKRDKLGLTQVQAADVLGVPNDSYYSNFETGRIDFRRSSKYLPQILKEFKITSQEAREILGLDLMTDENTNSRLTSVQIAARAAAIREFQDELEPASFHPVYSSGAGGAFRDDEEPVEHVNFPRTITDRYPNALFMRVDGSCLEPEVPEGHYAVILPEPSLAQAGSMVCVWFSDNGRKFGYLFESREEGDHIIVQTNPAKAIIAPAGSVVLGVVVDLYAPPSVPKLKARALYSIIAETAPYLLEDEKDN